MKISNVTCTRCGALYLLAESVSVDARAGVSSEHEACTVCGEGFAGASDGRLRAFRLEMSPAQRSMRTPQSPTISP